MSKHRIAGRFPRGEGAEQRGGSARVALLAVSGLLVLMAAGAEARAASIFMKNGYIIQGQVVERNEEAYVLGWPNGKVTIARRFIESVSYDPGEERRLEEEERLRRELQAAAGAETALLPAQNDTIELPATLEELMDGYGRERDALGNTDLPSDGIGLPSDLSGGMPPGDEPVSTPGMIPPPEDNLGERVDDAFRYLSVRPPAGWTAQSTETALVMKAEEPDAEGFRPSVNVVALPGGKLSAEQYAALLKEESTKVLQDFEVIEEGPRQLGTRSALQIIGRGTYQGQTATVRQVIVVDGDQAWLVSSFTKGPSDETFALTEESLESLEFTAR